MERFEQSKIEKDLRQEKPKVVYHGSPVSDLEELQPNDISIRSESEGKVVFASSDRAFASTFLGPRINDSWSSKGYINDIPYAVIADEERFRQEDHGGVIYEIPGDSFTQDASIGMDVEWTSKERVSPTHVTRYESALDAMIEHGIQVYFVDPHTLGAFTRAIHEEEDCGSSILEKLQSENQKQGRNIKKFTPTSVTGR